MRILAFSDLHRDLDQAANLVEKAEDCEVVVAAGDFANQHEGLGETIAALTPIAVPTLLVPGNNETESDLRQAVSNWSEATVLHGESAEVNGVTFFGLGGGIPTTPWDWSYDLDEEEAAEKAEMCPDDAVLILHSPPKDSCDESSGGQHLGSTALRDLIQQKDPILAVCGHIHEAWGARDEIGETPVANLGPEGVFFEV